MDRRLRISLLLALLLASVLSIASARPAPEEEVTDASSIIIYDDALAAGWENWSWSTTLNFSNTTPRHSGSTSIAVTYGPNWAGLSLRTPQLSASGYTGLSFWIYGGTGGTSLTVGIQPTDGGSQPASVAVNAAAGTWTQVSLTMAQLGNPATIARINWQETTGSARPTFYLDDITLIGDGAPPPELTLAVNVSAGRKPISEHIYGVNFPDEELSELLGLTIGRWGGNATSRYNWQANISNRGSDWYFENVHEERDATRTLPAGSASDLFVERNERTGIDSIITVPGIKATTAGTYYVSRADSPSNHPFFCGFPRTRFPNQASFDPWDSNCGNGRLNNQDLTGAVPADTSTAVNTAFLGNWVTHLVNSYGTAANGGVRFYALDNEPELWNETHRDIHPQATTYDELRDLAYSIAPVIKQRDPGAKILGPSPFGWWAYFFSAHDLEHGTWWNNPPDYAAHNQTYFTPWYLQQMKKYEDDHGTRILDYLDWHYYPQAPGVTLSGAGSAATQALRLRSTRALWDPTYTDESWIADGLIKEVNLIPRMREWINANYPGTKIAITEYNWGGLEHINGVLAQADVLGIFGREGVDLATFWGDLRDPETDVLLPGIFAFRMYRNYDGNHSTFGQTSVQATSSDQSQLAIYAAERSDGKLTLMVINKTGGALSPAIALTGFGDTGAAEVYRYSGTNLNAIVRGADIGYSSGSISASYPANSITLLVVDGGAEPPPPGNSWNYAPLLPR